MNNGRELDTMCANIRFLRKKYGLTQKAMAQLLHISEGYVRRIERGEVPDRLTVGFLYYIHRSFGILPHNLVGTDLETASKQ